MTCRTRRVVTLLALGLLAACSGDSPASLTQSTSDEPSTPPTGEPALRTVGDEQLLEVGQTITLKPVSSISRFRNIWWKSSNPAVASVTSGKVTAVSEGTATITALSWGGEQTWTVFAYSRGTSTLIVTPGSPTVDVGQKSVPLTTTVHTKAGESFTVADVKYQISNSAVATMDSRQIVGVSRGSTTLHVSALGMSASAPVSVQDAAAPSPEAPLPPSLASFELLPGGPLTVAAGASQRFSASAIWSDGTTHETRSIVVRYSATGGFVDNLGNFVAPSSAGEYLVIGAPDGSTLRDTVRVTVQAPTLTGFAISPRAVSAVAGTTTQFAVVTTWSDGQARSTSVMYSAPNGGSVSSTGLFTAPASAGTYRVIAAEANGSRRDTAVVTVTAAALESLMLTPRTPSVPAGLTQQFSVSARWTDGSTTIPSLSWSTLGSGSVTPSGLYTAPANPGTYRLVVAHAGGTLRDTATITVTAPTVTSLSVSPGTTSLSTGGTRQFTASALLSNGQTSAPAVIWSRIGSGTISSSGLYTAPSTVGTYRVVATLTGGTFADTAVVTVVAPTVTAFTLSPETVTLSSGQTRQFSTTVQWSDGATRSVTVSYQATGGTVTSAGLYTAGQVAGTFALIATCSCGVADTSAITISAPQLSSLSITPKTATIQTGAQQQFGATALWSTGATTLPPIAYSVIGGSASGTVNSTTGLYTAPSAAGTYRVVVAHTGGTLRDTATVTVTGTTAPPPPTGSSQWNLATNLPAGLTMRTDTDHSTLVPAGWGGIAQRSGPNPTIVSDASAPTGGTNVMRQHWGGVPDRESPNFLYRNTPATHIFVSTVVRVPQTLMPGNEVKWLTWMTGGGPMWLGFYGARGTWGYNNLGLRDSDTEMMFVSGSSAGHALSQRVGDRMQIPIDQWMKVQIELRISPARVRVWINDVLIHTETSSWSWGGHTNFGEFQMGSTWGGGNITAVPSGAVIDYARTAIWTN